MIVDHIPGDLIRFFPGSVRRLPSSHADLPFPGAPALLGTGLRCAICVAFGRHGKGPHNPRNLVHLIPFTAGGRVPETSVLYQHSVGTSSVSHILWCPHVVLSSFWPHLHGIWVAGLGQLGRRDSGKPAGFAVSFHAVRSPTRFWGLLGWAERSSLCSARPAPTRLANV